MPTDPHLERIEKPKGKVSSLRNGSHQIASHAEGDRLISHIMLRPHVASSDPEHDDPHTLAYYRTPQTRQNLADFGSLHFGLNQSSLDPAEQAQLKETAAQINQYLHTNPNTSLSISGFTDSVGGDKTNQRLSEQRAKNVLDALTPLLDADVRERVIMNTEGHGANRPVEEGVEISQANRRVELSAISNVKRQYHDVMYVPTAAYPALIDKPQVLDFGFGAKTEEMFGRKSKEEAHASLVFESALGNVPPGKIPKLHIVIEDPENLRLLIRTKVGNGTQASIMQTDDKHLRLYTEKGLVAEVEVRGPDGRPRDLNKVALGSVNEAGDIASIERIDAPNVLQTREKKVNIHQPEEQFPTSAPQVPKSHVSPTVVPRR